MLDPCYNDCYTQNESKDENSLSIHSSDESGSSPSSGSGTSDDDDDDSDGSESTSSSSSENKTRHHVNKNNIDIDKYLTPDEKKRARRIFYHCSNDPAQMTDSRGLDFEQFSIALAILGHIEKMTTLQQLFIQKQHEHDNIDLISFDIFLELLATLRKNVISAGDEKSDNSLQIKEAFDSLCQSTCPDGSQQDADGNLYVTASDLRMILTTQGDRLSDEEADELIKECHPLWQTGVDGKRHGKIFFQQYRSMLFDTGV